MNSKVLSIPNIADLLKASFMLGITAIITGLYTSLTAAVPHFPVSWSDWKPILLVGATSFVGSLVKTISTNSAGQLLQSESTPAAQALTAAKAITPDLIGQTK